MYGVIDFSHERNLSLDDLIRRTEAYYPDADFVMLRKAYIFAEKAHKGQKRNSGEEYIIHPVNVASILIKLRMDVDTIISGLLHDVVEDCNVSPEEIEKEFNTNISQIVVGLTKISKIKFKTHEESQAENFRKMVVAMAKDIRVIIVKLADRMHNMRTLQYMSEEKQIKIAQETLDIYVPLASRLGINSVKSELEDLCLRFLHPDIYYRLAEKMAMGRKEREEYIQKVIEVIQERLAEYSINAVVHGRSKHYYSIYKKMVDRGIEFDQVQDILAFRIIVDNITECYKILGVMHSSYTPIPGRFKDYIAIPKVNGYQSLHTTVIGLHGERSEIQIRTHTMDKIAATGVAAHWHYKEGIAGGDAKFDWINHLLEVNKSIKSSSEFMDVVKGDLDVGGIFIFTPKGDVKELVYDATPLDFAYAIHTNVGEQCVGAKINGKMVPLRYVLQSGDTVEILTNSNQTPSKDWLNIVKSSRARGKIKQWLLRADRDARKEKGKEILERSLSVVGMSLKEIKNNNSIKNFFKKFNIANEEELFLFIGSGRCKAKDVVECLPESKTKNNKASGGNTAIVSKIDGYLEEFKRVVFKKVHGDGPVIVDGMDNIVSSLANCCSPIPGDAIMGYITKRRGITIHTTSCHRVLQYDNDRMVKVEWNPTFKFKQSVGVKVVAKDKPGILSVISNAISKDGVNITSAVAKSLPDSKGSFIFEIQVNDYADLLKTLSRIETIEEVISVSRV